ncbi:hypothetical protein G6F57_016643 [Rhizopus arrhizus]|nr:hypothetical protein G6F57_016643 [Rhizopus arrhizus]
MEGQRLRGAAAQAAAGTHQREQQPGQRKCRPWQQRHRQQATGLQEHAGTQHCGRAESSQQALAGGNRDGRGQRPRQHQCADARGAVTGLVQLQGADQLTADEHARHRQIHQHRQAQAAMEQQRPAQQRLWLPTCMPQVDHGEHHRDHQQAAAGKTMPGFAQPGQRQQQRAQRRHRGGQRMGLQARRSTTDVGGHPRQHQPNRHECQRQAGPEHTAPGQPLHQQPAQRWRQCRHQQRHQQDAPGQRATLVGRALPVGRRLGHRNQQATGQALQQAPPQQPADTRRGSRQRSGGREQQQCYQQQAALATARYRPRPGCRRRHAARPPMPDRPPWQ